jgi:hypothetical protein
MAHPDDMPCVPSVISLLVPLLETGIVAASLLRRRTALNNLP